MISFASDYIAGAHPKVLERLIETNLETLSGYGTDEYCEVAAEKIKKACGCPTAGVFFLAGGTQTNQVVISTMLKDYEGVLCAETGHVSAHEAGAIEFSGHKVLTIPGHDGKIDAAGIKKFADKFYGDDSHEHMVFPGMVYISFPTEYGTIYSKNELEEIYKMAHAYDMSVFIDGARLAYGLESLKADVTMEDIARLSDVFYVGGTKCGALCGEAVVFTKGNMPAHFVPSVKRRGALLAKGRLLGVQFDALFTDGLYSEIGRYAIEKAEELKKIFAEKGYRFFIDSPTNQQFVIMSDEKLRELSDKVTYSFWEKYSDTETVVRFATSWSTTEEELDYLREIL